MSLHVYCNGVLFFYSKKEENISRTENVMDTNTLETNQINEAGLTEEDARNLRIREIERSIIKKFRKPVWRRFTKAINEYELIKDGDKIAVCISGGKDSMLLAKCLQQLKRQSRTDFELEFIVMDPGYNPDNRKMIEDNAALMNIPVRIFDSDIFDIVVDVEQSPCYLCARMRRGYLYAHARELGCNKIALGHHFDDVLRPFLWESFTEARLIP